MLYKKNQRPDLEDALFRAPTSEYRGTPFWAWNCQLEQGMLSEQIEGLKAMGFGGFHMHVRAGMATEYLSKEYMDLITGCVDKAEQEEMLAWLYDEDRWPSGAAGGYVTKEKKFRQRLLRVIPQERLAEDAWEEDELLAVYDVRLDTEGCLASYERIAPNAVASGDKWYAFAGYSPKTGTFNGESYVNTMDKASIDRFIEITHELYAKTLGDRFDQSVPAIFADEPQFYSKQTLQFSTEKATVHLPWTHDLPETFAATYNEDLMAHLPELLWELPDGKISTVRYHYHDHTTERFAEAFMDNIGDWCREHNIHFTGHINAEEKLQTQTVCSGEAMRCYRKMGLPGIDMLCNNHEYTTAKQVQSCVHQYGREGMMSELYGVTNWDFDFRGHKLHGDWQAALGVTVRVPHLSWVSMKGRAKRDYPASINYQSPWYKEYPYVEDHFARVNTAMTRGKPIVKVGVIHPIESYWLHWGPGEQTALVRDQLDECFQKMTQWLLFGGIDFDFISESLLPDLCEKGSAPLSVGEMQYDTILVPCCETLRTSTLERLEAFRAQGGNLVFMGNAPRYADALPSDRGRILYEKSTVVNQDPASLLQAMESERQVEFRSADGRLTQNLLYQLRQDNNCRWLFLAHGKDTYGINLAEAKSLRIRVKGSWCVKLYDTINGTISPMESTRKNGWTCLETKIHACDSLLLRLEPTEETEISLPSAKKITPPATDLRVPTVVPVTLSEPNVYVLDQAEFSIDGEPFRESEEILRIDRICKDALGWPPMQTVQPWAIPEEPSSHRVALRFVIHSEIEAENLLLAMEDAELTRITLNGSPVPSVAEGWYTDKSIGTVRLPKIQKGDNQLVVEWPFGKRSFLEYCYLLGDFGVKVTGSHQLLIPPVRELGFGNVTAQGLPFYGGNITYHLPYSGAGDLDLIVSNYRGALVKVAVDGDPVGRIVYPPYRLTLPSLAEGDHTIDVTLFGTRINTFGQLHYVPFDNIDRYYPLEGTNWLTFWFNSNTWYTEGNRWSYDYQLHQVGILATPRLLQR